MSREHLSQEEMQAFTHGLLDKKKADEVIAHLAACGACHEQQSKMAMTAVFARAKEITEQNQQWTSSDPFWGIPYPAPAAPPPSKKGIRKWEAEHKVRLPPSLARALGTQNGGGVRGTEIMICPLAEFQFLTEPKWDPVFRFDQIASQRDKLLYVGFEEQVPASIILNYSQSSEASVLYLWHELGDELRQEAESFDALLASRLGIQPDPE